MVFVQQKQAAKEFANHRKNKWDEKQETQKFWNGLLQEIFWVKANDIKNVIDYEKTVKIDTTKFIDWYINDTKVLIEQKSCDVDLNKAEKQSDWAEFTPYQQAKRYADNLPHSENPRRIITCNFQEFHIHDMEKQKPWDNPEIVYLKDLEKEYHRLWFIVDPWDENIKKEMELSIKAWEIVWKLYDELAPLYKDITNPKSQKSLNILCVRIVFCLYAEDAWVFGRKNLFHDYLAHYSAEDMREALIRLFQVLDQKDGERDQYLKDELKAFPYVNWWLFADEDIEIPMMNEKVKNLILKQASEDFDRSEISPTIFGAVFESTLNPETRRSGGMHYTSIENIHKVIDPLFLDNLNEELEHILTLSKWYEILKQWKELQDKISNLTFLDPACGSGNFLTETYLSLRKIENKIIEKEWKWQARLINPIKVNINQFYGIEINDFAVSVAKTALRIAESQMMNETENILWESLDFLPLKTNANIVEGNALRMDWNDVVKKENLNYIMGNPPFVWAMWSKWSQRDDISIVFPECEKTWQIDYVAWWFVKTAKFIRKTNIRCAFVSTNSLCQWQQVDLVRNPMFNLFDTKIDFAHRTFQRDSEANLKAHVHCVIVWFSWKDIKTEKVIFDWDKKTKVDNINWYLSNSQNIFISSRNNQISNMPLMHMWVMARDWWNLILSEEEYQEYIKLEPQWKQFIHKYMMWKEFINNINRYCFRLVDANPIEMKKCPLLIKRIEAVRQERLNSPAKETQKLAETPYLFAQLAQPTSNFIALPKVSSEKRRYIPIGFLDKDVIVWDKLYVVENVWLYHFWILTSNVHNSRMRTVAWRLKSDYSYSNTIVYNNFPRPTPTADQKKKIEQTAKAILDARNLYPDSSLADLYDELTMPIELRKAHQENDKAVMEAYWFSTKMSESDIVSKLMEMYQELVK